MFKYLAASVFALALAGCVASSPGPQVPVVTFQPFHAPLNVPLVVGTGDELLVEGAFIKGEKISLREPVDRMIPGSLMIPFPAHMGAGDLELTRFDGDWKYFCGREDNVAASFPGLGSVIAEGDCVGIRVSTRDASDMEWVVDNSRHNGMTTIWTKSVSPAEKPTLNVEVSRRPFRVQSLNKISFDGYFGGQLHFTWTEEGTHRESKTFTFDYHGGTAVVGFKGRVLQVNQVNSLGLEYQWLTLAAATGVFSGSIYRRTSGFPRA